MGTLVVRLILVLSLFVAAASAQSVEVKWTLRQPLSEGDQQAILALAARVGIRNPSAAGDVVIASCRTISVASRPRVEGYRVTTDSVMVSQRTGDGCQPIPPGLPVYESGNWIVFQSARNPGRAELFRISDGDWHIDVHLQPGISYDDVEKVILALRRRTFVDVRQGRAGDITEIDLNRINRISRDDRMAELFPEVYGKTFSVYADNYKWVGVRINEGRVEFQGVSDWVQ
jgi:hypothetical protein